MKKRILVAGTGSYIGDSFQQYLEQWPGVYEVFCLDMIGDGWKSHDFSEYDAVYLVAGIAHVKETDENRALYYRVNRDLALEAAQKAKTAGVRQFVYLSSMSVYGREEGVITADTPLNPKNAYGKSKAQAEELLSKLESSDFAVAILRPPMVYGKGCRGNYRSLEKLALKLPFFPKVNNRRSMLYIDNLSECVRLVVDQGLRGCFCVQNRETVCTWDMAQRIARANDRRLYPEVLTGIVIRWMLRWTPVLRKAFGSLVYEGVERLEYRYCVADYEDSIRRMYSH